MHIDIVTNGAPWRIRSAVVGDDRWRMLEGGDELHQHHVSSLMRVGGFWIKTNELLRDRLGFRLRFGSPVFGVHIMALESVGPHSMANLIGAHIFNKKKKL